MPLSKIEPLDPELWFKRAADLLERFHSSGAGDLESAIRRAYHLVQLTPRPLKSFLKPAIGEDDFERLLDVGALESAAMGLVGEPAGILVSRMQGASKYEAIVWLQEDGNQAKPTSHENAAGAIVGALLECLEVFRISIPAPITAINRGQTRPLRHRHRSERRRQKKPH